MREKIKIAILDDDLLFVEGIAVLLAGHPLFEVQFKTNNPITLLAHLKETKSLPDILLLDLNMQPITGLEVMDQINKNQIQLKTIVLSSIFNSSMYGYMIKYSISAFLPKYIEKEELFTAIEQCYSQKVYVNSENKKLLDEYMAFEKRSKNPWKKASLSDRETEVLLCICKEMSTKEIAEKLCISVKTVESHRSKLMEKIGCKNAIGMVIYAILNGLFI